MIKKNFKLDKLLITFILIFLVISIVTINSAMLFLPDYLGNLAIKQLIWYSIGLIIMLIIIKIGNDKILNYAWYIYGICLLLLILLFPFGTVVNHSRCWFIIPGIGSIQPSEFMKIALILVLAKETTKFNSYKNRSLKAEFFYLIKVIIIVLVPSILTFLEPDTGAVLMYFIVALSIVLLSNIKKRWFIIALGLLLIISTGIFYFYTYKTNLLINLLGTDMFYRFDRLLDWKTGVGFQLENALTSIGTSGLWGHGYNRIPLYFPEAGTDFIFAIFASNFGYVGSLIFILLLILFNSYLFYITLINYDKPINQYLIISILGLLIFQQLQNIGMTIGLVPITGITLPFISYGGSSLLSYLILMGIVLNISSKKGG
ncbi:MAG: FtsW/RodA/SpoVE family cell cycle protein [Bacilli bacterium]